MRWGSKHINSLRWKKNGCLYALEGAAIESVLWYITFEDSCGVLSLWKSQGSAEVAHLAALEKLPSDSRIEVCHFLPPDVQKFNVCVDVVLYYIRNKMKYVVFISFQPYLPQKRTLRLLYTCLLWSFMPLPGRQQRGELRSSQIPVFRAMFVACL